MARAIGVAGKAAFLASVFCVLTACGATSSEPRAGTLNDLSATTSSKRGDGLRGERDASELRSVGFVAAALGASAAEAEAERARVACRQGMVSIEGRFCIDRYEASLVEVLETGEERPADPFATVPPHKRVRAVSEANVPPQGYISRNQAERACVASGKRLCRAAEWQQACRGPENRQYGYADQREVGRCNDNGKNPVVTLYGRRYDASTMNRSRLNQMDGTLAKTGERAGCSNGYGVYDMVGNLHEWIADPKGTFYGGYYQDVSSVGHGEGCGYVTTAHEARYHDYSTGFRCCADVAGSDSLANAPAEPAPVARPPKKAPKPRGPKRRK